MTNPSQPVSARLTDEQIEQARWEARTGLKIGLCDEGSALAYRALLQVSADLAAANLAKDRAYHFHRRNECPKCRRVATQATDNDYGAGKYGVYDVDCPCETEAELRALQAKAREAVEAARIRYDIGFGKNEADRLLMDLAALLPKEGGR